jgi:glucokinase
MVSIYGAQAGNLALTVLPTGGVYLGGGIAPRIAERLREGEFMEAFTSKGRMSGLLAEIPVWVILNDRAALLGAARHAAQRAPATR